MVGRERSAKVRRMTTPETGTVNMQGSHPVLVLHVRVMRQ